MSGKWEYLEAKPAPDAPVSDNPSGLYCLPCRATGLSHCAYPEECGQMRRMRPTFTGADLLEVARRAAEAGWQVGWDGDSLTEQVAEQVVRDFLKEREAKP